MINSLFYFIVFSLTILPFASRSHAAELQVQVFFKGEPAKGATVCAGSVQQRGLYKITTTDENGSVIFHKVPEGRVVITANDNHHGKDKIITNAGYQQNVMIALPDSEEGPLCPINQNKNMNKKRP